MTKRPPKTAHELLNRLEREPFSEPAHFMLREVRNGTGARGGDRRADALVVSCWPSRGIWFAGIEVKVDRVDWRRELRNPEKSAEIQQYCDYWYLSAPPGIVELDEVPVSWGFIEVAAKARIVKPAPKLEAKPLDTSFVASLLRNRNKIETAMRTEISNAVSAEHAAQFEGAANAPRNLQADLIEMTAKYENAERARVSETETRSRFEALTGIHLSSWNVEGQAQAFDFARNLVRHRRTLRNMIEAGTAAAAAEAEFEALERAQEKSA